MKWQLVEKNGIHYFEFSYEDIIFINSIKGYGQPIIKCFKPILLNQIHSEKIIDLDTEALTDGDGLLTRKRNTWLGIKVADCLPVLLFNKEKICIIHCGWRGVIKGIAKRARELMKSYQYVLGASIGACCYEVGNEVKEFFLKGYPDALIYRKTKSFLDLKAAVITDLGREHLLTSLNLCTQCNAQYFYSYRRGDSDNRNYGLAVRR